MNTLSLEELNRQIAQREQELEALRQELESRRNQFTTLTRRKEELLEQLRQVESEIAALAATAPTPVPGTPSQERLSMPKMILAILQEVSRPMTARQLTEELRRRGFPLKGHNPAKSVETRLRELKQKGFVRRADGQPGYVLIPTHGAKAAKPRADASLPKKTKTTAKPGEPAPAARSTQPGPKGQQPTLRQVLTRILENNDRKFFTGSELAKLALAAGYKTKSVKFADSVWSMLRHMDNVEYVKDKGYRL